MITFPFDVNNDKLRVTFLDHIVPGCIATLTEDTIPLWGRMSPQDMVEHLIRVFQCSTGKFEVQCNTPEEIRKRAKTFLYDDKPTPHDFRNPLVGEKIPRLLYLSFTDATNALRKEILYFINHFKEEPLAVHVHPLFGPMGAEEWQRSHFKHCYHHLLQFGLINQN